MKKASSNITKRGIIFTVIITAVMMVSSVSAVFADDILVPDDFKEESWSKTIDYLDYVDLYAVTHGKPRPPRGAEANIFMTYVNQSGVEMLYAGLSNITMGYETVSVTLPIQTFMMHYKSEDIQQDVVSASSYLMLMAYNESQNTLYEDSPDKNDILYASFSLGFDLSSLLDTDAPALNSKTTTTPLSHPDENTWSWSMTYTNLTAIWWNIQIDADNASYQSIPVAITVYDELTFSYDLIFDQQSNTAQIVSNYAIGEMTDLILIDDFIWIFPVIVHYNATGCYKLNGEPYSTQTIHQFLANNNIDMSMVFFQASAILDHITESTVDGQDVAEEEVDVSDDTIVTESDEGERICSVDFGSKDTYVLYNSTSGTSNSYDVVVRTVDKEGYADNPVFDTHTFLMNYIPLALAYIDEPLYEQYKDELLNMTYADYFYVISYPTYDGYKIEHDPIYTVFLAQTEETQTTTDDPNIEGVLVLGIVAAVVVVVVVVLLRRKK